MRNGEARTSRECGERVAVSSVSSTDRFGTKVLKGLCMRCYGTQVGSDDRGPASAGCDWVVGTCGAQGSRICSFTDPTERRT